MRTNILCQYQGGGYSGNHWEWNYFYIDKTEMFHNIFSSGKAGIDNKQDAIELIEQNESSTYIYDISNEQDIETFSEECNPVHIFIVLKWFEDYNDADIEFFAVCSDCGCRIDSCDDMTIEGDSLFCNDCYYMGECSCCESYVGETEIVEVNPDEHHGFDHICKDCKEYHDEERE